jgi:glycine betaine/choline ABC-type transport system substrate-binding protein
MANAKRIYCCYVADPKKFESGTTVYNLSFKEEQVNDLLKYKTKSGNVNCDFVVMKDDKAFMTVFDPNDPENQKYMKNKPEEVKEDLPF